MLMLLSNLYQDLRMIRIIFTGTKKNLFRDDTHMTSMKIVQLFKTPHPPYLHPKFVHPFHLGRPNSSEPPPPPPLRMITNKFKENILQR